MKHLVMLQTGGTLAMRKTGNTLALDHSPRDLANEVPALSRLATWETEAVMALDSGDMQPSHWISLAERVHAALARSDVDGVVVVHGTDTMAYTASALALLFGPIPKPVVLTGAQRPLDEPLTDARANLESAAVVATLDVPEVLVAFGGHAFRGVRTTKKDAWSYEAFDSPNVPPLVELGVDVTVGTHVRAAGALAPFDARIEKRVLAVRVFPGLDPALLRGALRAGVKGLVLEAYGSGNLPHAFGSLAPVLDEARDRSIPVLVVSQCLRGRVELGRYGGGASAEASGAMSAGDMTAEAALVKMMVGIGRHASGASLREFLERDVAGERA
jgi:L-asparaginase